jgi:hypothetical protein
LAWHVRRDLPPAIAHLASNPLSRKLFRRVKQVSRISIFAKRQDRRMLEQQQSMVTLAAHDLLMQRELNIKRLPVGNKVQRNDI